MGDPHGNSLPECQIDRITHFVEGIRWKDRKDTPENPNLSDGIGFWMDTLCRYPDSYHLNNVGIIWCN